MSPVPSQFSNDGHGSYPVGSLTPYDKYYLYMKMHAYDYLPFDILSGSRDEINSVINTGALTSLNADGSLTGPGGQDYPPQGPTPTFKALADARVQEVQLANVMRHKTVHEEELAKWQRRYPNMDTNAVLARLKRAGA